MLDYLPCEACLAQPVDDQELLCSICARLDRQVAVRVGTRTTIVVERPSPPPAPVVIPPAPAPEPEPAPPAPLREVVVRFASEEARAKPGAIEVVVEPLAAPPAPVPGPLPVPVPEAALAAEIAPPEEEDAWAIDDIVEYTRARDEFFDYRKPAAAEAPEPARAAEPEPAPAPAPPPPRAPPEPVAEDDFVFRPPAHEEPARREEPVVQDDVIPVDEVPLESPPEEQERWAPPPDFLADEEEPAPPAPAPPEEVEEIVELEAVPEEEPVVEMEVLPEDEEVVEMEVVEDEPEPPAPSATGDLYRLRGFDAASGAALAKARITQLSHLSGHDAGELAQRTGLPLPKLQPWIQVADLVEEVGVPVDAAVALVAAGVAGPRGLRDADEDEVADRASAFGGYAVNARDVRRWKRRA